MTATRVMGLPVVDTFIVPTGTTIKNRGIDTGQPAMFKQIIGLVLSNGARVYGCAHDGCDYARENVRSVIPHLNKHGVKGDKTSPRGQRLAKAEEAANSGDLSKMAGISMAELRRMSLEDILKLVNKARWITDNQGEWKPRALKAEAELAALRELVRQALGGSTTTGLTG